MNLFEKWRFQRFLNSLTISKIDALSGLEFEEFVLEFFSYIGYRTNLTSQSGDNGIDVVAKCRRHSIGIQAKLYYNHNVNNKAVQEVFSGKNHYKLTHAMIITNWTLSRPALDLSKSLNVIVIDRKIMRNIIKNNRKENIRLIKDLINNCLGE